MKKVLSKDIPYTVIHSLYSDTQGNIGIISLTASPSSSSNNMLVWNPGSTFIALSVTTGFKNPISLSSSSKSPTNPSSFSVRSLSDSFSSSNSANFV